VETRLDCDAILDMRWLFQHHGVEMLRLGRLARIHPSLHQFSDEFLTRDVSSVDELDKFYASKVRFLQFCLLLYVLIRRGVNPIKLAYD